MNFSSAQPTKGKTLNKLIVIVFAGLLSFAGLVQAQSATVPVEGSRQVVWQAFADPVGGTVNLSTMQRGENVAYDRAAMTRFNQMVLLLEKFGLKKVSATHQGFTVPDGSKSVRPNCYIHMEDKQRGSVPEMLIYCVRNKEDRFIGPTTALRHVEKGFGVFREEYNIALARSFPLPAGKEKR